MEYIDAKRIITDGGHLNWDYLACEYFMNIYWGCSHGCIYCYARSDYYDKIGKLGGNFDLIRAKKDALHIIRDDLQRLPKPGVVFTGGMSDAYNPEENEQRLTRNALELFNAFGFGACVLTKSSLVTRDADVLSDIIIHSPVSVNFSITCSDDETCGKIEPFVSATSERFKAIEYLAGRGITTGVMMDPVIPYITDDPENVREMVKKAKYHGASFMYISTQVTMSDGQREYFNREAEKYYPGISEKYSDKYGKYYYCRSPRAKKLWDIFTEACLKEDLNFNMRTANKLIRRGYDNLTALGNLIR
jgi:DNA repair photolyase